MLTYIKDWNWRTVFQLGTLYIIIIVYQLKMKFKSERAQYVIYITHHQLLWNFTNDCIHWNISSGKKLLIEKITQQTETIDSVQSECEEDNDNSTDILENRINVTSHAPFTGNIFDFLTSDFVEFQSCLVYIEIIYIFIYSFLFWLINCKTTIWKWILKKINFLLYIRKIYALRKKT